MLISPCSVARKRYCPMYTLCTGTLDALDALDALDVLDALDALDDLDVLRSWVKLKVNTFEPQHRSQAGLVVQRQEIEKREKVKQKDSQSC